jgi:hypothetical protein
MMTTADDLTTCDGCDAEMTEVLYEASEGLCDACMRKRLVCKECGELILKTDAHASHETLCQDCGESKDEEMAESELEAAKDELDELTEEIKGLDDIDAIRKAIKVLKRIVK